MLIHRNILSVAAAATADDVVRYGINCVQVRPNGVVVGTNGHIAVQVFERHRSPDDEFPNVAGVPELIDASAPVYIDAAAVKRLVGGTKKKGSIPVLECVRVGTSPDGEPKAVSTDLDASVVLRLSDIKFPDVDMVIPGANDDAVTLTLGLPMLKTLVNVLSAMKDGASITFQIPASTDPPAPISEAVRATAETGDMTVVMAIMPMRK